MNKKRRYDGIIIGITAVFFILILVFNGINQEGFMNFLDTILNYLYDKLGWIFNICTLFAIFFAIFFLVSKYGKIKIGGPDAKPEFTRFKWWAISLCGGMGMGIVFFPAAEVIEYAFRPATGLGLEAGSYRSIVWGMEQTMMHWTLTLYGVYVLGGVMAAYCVYNMKKPFSATSTLVPTFGEKVFKYRSWIDGIICFALCGGTAGAFGYGILQVSDGLYQILGISKNAITFSLIALVITVAATVTSVTGLKKGIQWLGDNNAKMFILLLIFVAIFGSTTFSANLGLESLGSMVNNFFKNMTLTEPMGGDGEMVDLVELAVVYRLLYLGAYYRIIFGSSCKGAYTKRVCCC